jgi:hypothetical protein
MAVPNFCAVCGTGVQPDASFCHACGSTLGQSSLMLSDTPPAPSGPGPVVVNIHAAPPVPSHTVVVSDGNVVVGDASVTAVVGSHHLTGIERLAVGAAVVVGGFMSLTLAPVRTALLVLLPLPVLAYTWWLYAGEPRGGRLWSALAESLPGARALTPRQRRALVALLVAGVIWVAIFLLNHFASSPGGGEAGPFSQPLVLGWGEIS